MLSQEVSDGYMSFWNGMFRLAIRVRDTQYIFDLDIGDSVVYNEEPRLRTKVADIMNQTMSAEVAPWVQRMVTAANEFVKSPESFPVTDFHEATRERVPLHEIIIWHSNHDLEDPDVLSGMFTAFYPTIKGWMSVNFAWDTNGEHLNVDCEFRQTITLESAAQHVYNIKAIINGTSNLPPRIAWNAQRCIEIAAMQTHWLRETSTN